MHPHRRSCRALPLLCLLLAFACTARAQHKDAPQLLADLGHATLSLEGPWQFQPGDNLAYASPSFDDSAWKPILAGKSWEQQGFYGLTGFAWYRIHLVVPPSAAGLPLALNLPRVDSASEIYWNGKLVGSIGRVPPNPVWYFSGNNPSATIDLGSAHSGVLAIRVWRAPRVFYAFPYEGGLLAVPSIGTRTAVDALASSVRAERLENEQITHGLYLLLVCAGLITFLMWLRHRRRWVLLSLSAVLLFPMELHFIAGSPGGMNFRASYALISIAVALYNIALWSLLIHFLGLENRLRLVRCTRILAIGMVAISLVDTVFQFFDWTVHFAHTFLAVDIVSTLPSVLLEFWSIVLVLAALRQRLDDARWLLAITAMITGLTQAVEDSTGLGVRWTHWTISNYLSTPLIDFDGGQLNLRDIANTAFLAAVLYVAWRISEQNRLQQSRLEQEFQSARQLQQMVIPEALPTLPGYRLTSAYRPAREVGGDFFQVIPLDSGETLIVLGDVSGKGLTAAMATTMLVGAIRVTAAHNSDPGALLEAVNLRLPAGLGGGFATCMALRLSPGGACIAASAGHLPPYRNAQEFDLPPALPLGIVPGVSYQSVPLPLAPGDCLTLYTDGILEARSPSGELFGFDRLARLLAGNPSAAAIADAAQQFGQDDDITVLTLEVEG
ncbi:MAG TPA: PP2C family protein-serine/threonine phosphatase [Terracidiphilus sp.]